MELTGAGAGAAVVDAADETLPVAALSLPRDTAGTDSLDSAFVGLGLDTSEGVDGLVAALDWPLALMTGVSAVFALYTTLYHTNRFTTTIPRTV